MSRPVSTRVLLAASALLVAAVVFLPWPLAQLITGSSWPGPDDLAHTVADGFVVDHRGGTSPGAAGSALHGPTEFWRWFHLLKAVVAVLLVVVVGALVLRCRPRFETSRVRRLARLIAGGAAATLTLVAVVVVIANVQGAFAPLSSIISFLPQAPGVEVAAVARDVRLDIATSSPAPPTNALVDDFATYHAVLAATAACLAISGLVLAVRLWRNRSRFGSSAMGFGVLGFAVIAAANVSTAITPGPAFAAFLGGVG